MSAHIGVIQQWLNSGSKESPLEIAQILLTITFNGPFFAAGLKKENLRKNRETNLEKSASLPLLFIAYSTILPL